MKELQEKEYVEIIRETHIKRDNNNDYVYDSNGNKGVWSSNRDNVFRYTFKRQLRSQSEQG